MPGLVAHQTKLEAKVGEAWEEIANIRSFPSLKGKPVQVDTSVVTGKNKTYAPGQTDPGELEFLCAYGSDEVGVSAQDATTNYGILKSLSDTPTEYRVRYPDNSGYTLTAKNHVGSPNQFEGANNALEFPLTLYPIGDVVDVAKITA